MVEEHTTSIEMNKIFDDLFNSLDLIDKQIHESGLKAIDEKYQKIENNLNEISVSLNNIEKKLKISFFYKIKKQFILLFDLKKMMVTR